MKDLWCLYYLRKLLIAAAGDSNTSSCHGPDVDSADEIGAGAQAYVSSALDVQTVERVRQFCSSYFPNCVAKRSIELRVFSPPHSREPENRNDSSHTIDAAQDLTSEGM